MGSVLTGCTARKLHWTTTVESEPTYEREAPSINGLGRCHVLIFAMDYAGTENQMSNCVRDGKAMADLARTYCGVTSIIEHYERQCTISKLEHAFGQAKKRMQNDDYLVFIFLGHAMEAYGGSGDEDGSVFVDQNSLALHFFESDGTVVEYSCARFTELVTSSVNSRGRILMMFDCSYGSSMVDFADPVWDDLEVISLSGVDDRTEVDDGYINGLFTMYLLSAVQQLQKEGDSHYSVGAVFNKMLKGRKDRDSEYSRDCRFWLEHSMAVSPSSMAWPMLPSMKYRPTFPQVGELS